MRILTVRQPWAWAIIHGGKDVENRSRNIVGDYRGPVAVHAGRGLDPRETFDPRHPGVAQAIRALDAAGWPDLEFAAIIGVVDLVDVHVARATASGRLVDWADHTKPDERCSSWAEWGDRYHLVFANPRPLEPIPYKGGPGLRTLPAEVEAAVLTGVKS